MKIQKAYRFKLKPTSDQESMFRQFAGAVRWVWNKMLTQRQHTYRTTGKSPSKFEQMKCLTELKTQQNTAWLKQIHSQVLQNSIKNLDRAFANFFKKRARYPKFKSKRNMKISFSYPQGIKVDGNRVYLPKIGWVRFRKSQKIDGDIFFTNCPIILFVKTKQL